MSKFSLFDKGRGGQAEALSSQLTLGESDGNLLRPKIQSETPESVELCRKDLTCFLPHHPHQLKFRENPPVIEFPKQPHLAISRSQLKNITSLSLSFTHQVSLRIVDWLLIVSQNIFYHSCNMSVEALEVWMTFLKIALGRKVGPGESIFVGLKVRRDPKKRRRSGEGIDFGSC